MAPFAHNRSATYSRMILNSVREIFYARQSYLSYLLFDFICYGAEKVIISLNLPW